MTVRMINMKNSVYQPLSESSRIFLKLKKVYRYRLKKVSEMSDTEIIQACHSYVEENLLNEEWEDFRERNEGNINFDASQQ